MELELIIEQHEIIRTVEVEGVITSFDPNENETTYAFSFAGTNYYDRFLYHQGSRPDYPKTGEKLNVTVDPENPSRYNLGNINAQFNQFSDSLKGILFITVGLFLIQLFRLLPNPFSRSDQQGKEEWEKYRKGP